MRAPLFAIGLVVALAACAAPADSPASTESEAPSASTEAAATTEDALEVTLADFVIDPDELEVAGETVTIAVVNDGPTPHNLTIRDEAGDVVIKTADLSTGDAETISADLEPGEYTTFCSLPGHESLGMSGTLTVSAP